MTKLEKDHLEILLEHIDGKFTFVVEAVDALKKTINDVRTELKEDIKVVDCKVMGLSKRLDGVEQRLSAEIAEVRADLADHRANTELHHTPKKRLKQA